MKATLQSGTHSHCFPNLVHKTAIILEFGIPIKNLKVKAAARHFSLTKWDAAGSINAPTGDCPCTPRLDSSPLPRDPYGERIDRPKLKVTGRSTELAPPGRRLPGWTPAGAARSRSCACGSAAEGLSPRKAPEAEAEATRPTRLNMAESGWRLSAAAVLSAGPAAGAGQPPP